MDRHEKNKGHFKNVKTWFQLKKTFAKSGTEDSATQKLINNEQMRWPSGIKKYIYAVQYLAKQNLAFSFEI